MIDTSNSILIYSNNSKYHSTGYGGAEASLKLIAEKLTQNGIDVVYLTRGESKRPGLKKRLINGVTVYFFSPLKWPSFNNAVVKKYAQKFMSCQRQWVIARLIRKHRVKVVHTYSSHPDTYDVLLSRKRYGLNIRLIKRMAGLYWATKISYRMVSAKTIDYIFRNTDILNFVSKGLQTLFHSECRALGIRVDPEKHRIFDIGIDLEYYCPLPHRHSDPKKFTIVCAARFSKYPKRQDLLIEAVNALKNKNICISFVGQGPTIEQYKKQVRDHAMEDQVVFHGFLTGKKYIDVVRSADLFALPTEHEGRSKSIAEAMGMELPVIASDVVPLNRHLSHNNTGFLVKNSAEAWAGEILRLTQDRELLSRVARQGREYVCRHYDANKNIAHYIRLFQQV